MKYNTLVIAAISIAGLITLGAGCSSSTNINGYQTPVPSSTDNGNVSPPPTVSSTPTTTTSEENNEYNSSTSQTSNSVTTTVPMPVKIKNNQFSPKVLTLANNRTVRWTNMDKVIHTVTSDDNAFDSGPILPGATFVYTFSDKGNFSYHCTVHPQMKGKIVVK